MFSSVGCLDMRWQDAAEMLQQGQFDMELAPVTEALSWA